MPLIAQVFSAIVKIMNDLIIPAPQTLLSLFSSLFTTIAEEMIRGLMKVSWERIDVNFKRSTQRFLAHNTIQVSSAFSQNHTLHIYLIPFLVLLDATNKKIHCLLCFHNAN